jgi:ribosomal-protein-alanine N-acetyltransferase
MDADFPRLETERLVLRELVTGDALDVFRVGGDDRVMRFYDMDTFVDEERALTFIEAQRARFECKQGVRWGIVLRSEDRVVGWTGFTPVAEMRAEIGYVLAQHAWGSGFATEAVRAVVGHVFRTTDINRLEAYTYPENVASVRVLEKTGFRLEGLMREWGFWRGGFHDMQMNALLRKDVFESLETD